MVWESGQYTIIQILLGINRLHVTLSTYLGMYLSLMISKCELCSVSNDVLDTGNVLIDKLYIG